MDADFFNSLELDDQIKLAIKSKEPQVLDVICKSHCDAAIVFAARNKHTNPETLDALALTTKCQTVVDSLLINPKLLPSTRKILCKKWKRKAS